MQIMINYQNHTFIDWKIKLLIIRSEMVFTLIIITLNNKK